MLTFRRADGREVSLEEFPLAQGLSTGETVRAEEIVLQAPDGRSVTTLVNATPIRSEEGEVESVVVTLAGHDAAASWPICRWSSSPATAATRPSPRP